MNRRILLVDDDALVLSGYQRTLRNRFSLDTALGGEEALTHIRAHGPPAVLVADMQMPGMSGLDLLMKVERMAPDTVRMMLTGNADQKTAADAVNQGHVFRFLSKPCPNESFVLALAAGLEQHSLLTSERDLLERTLNGTIRLLADALSSLYPEAFGRGEILRDYVRTYVEFYQFKQSWDLEAAALLSPIGYLTMPASLIEKCRDNQPLTPVEWGLLERLPEIGANLLSHIPRFEGVADIVRYQAKHYDGQGCPADAVAGEAIPVGARILKVLHDLAVIESQFGSKEQALARMKEQSGIYDPRVLDSAFACFDVCIHRTTTAQSVIRPHTLNDLRVGQILAANVVTPDGLEVIASGTELTNVILHRLRNFSKLNPVQEPVYILD